MADDLPTGYTIDQPAQTDVPAGYTLDAPSPSASVFEHGAPPLPGLAAAPAPPDKYQQAAIAERDRLLNMGSTVPGGGPLREGFTRRLSAGPLLGWGDEIGAAMMTPFEMARQGTLNPAEGYRYAKAREDLASRATAEKTGTLGDVAEVVGGLATLPGNVFGRQAAAALGGGRAGVTGVLGRMAGYGAESGVLGAIQGAGNARTTGDMAHDALVGGALSGALGAPFGAFANVARRSTAAVPTEEELFKLGARDYRARDKLPTRYDLGSVGNTLTDLQRANRVKYGRDAPYTVNALGERAAEAAADVNAARALNPNPPGAVTNFGQISSAPNAWQAVATPRDIASLRREIYQEGARGTPTDERAGTIASKVVDRILSRPNPASLAGGTAQDAATAALLDARGRGNFAGAFRSRGVSDVIKNSEFIAAGQHSGLNFENILNQNVRKALKSDEFGALKPAEQVAAEALIKRNVKANTIREFGNMLGGGGGLGRMAAMGIGGGGTGAIGAYLYGGDPVMGAAGGLGLGLAGRGLRTYGNRQARLSAEEFSDMLRRRTPEYLSRAAVAPTEIGPGLSAPLRGTRQALTLGGGGSVRDAIANALLYQTTGRRNALGEQQ
jgi:hypothetical protein